MTHTFLFQPGRWSGAGTFWTEDGKATNAEVHIEVTHRADVWLLAGSLRVLCSPPVEFVNNYSIQIPAPDALCTKWSSESSAIGRQKGTFSIVGPSIVSLYRCEGAGYYGTEHLMQLGPDRYEVCAVLFLEERRLSSWRVALTREKQAER